MKPTIESGENMEQRTQVRAADRMGMDYAMQELRFLRALRDEMAG